MDSKIKIFNKRQLAFQELFIGSLIYVAVLGFFNDYTDIVYAKSFSTIILASIVLEILTYLAFLLKGKVIAWLKNRRGSSAKILMFFSVWLIMFVSKFVFIWVLDIFFGSYIRVKGFFGILLIVLTVTAMHKLAYFIFNSLGQDKSGAKP